MIKANADYMFEASWEVCNKVGGIYTVISSKAELLTKCYSNYFTIGPYFREQALIELEQVNPPEFLKDIFEELKKEGIICVYGKWTIKGGPMTILIDAKGLIDKKNDIKKEIWESHKVDSLFSGWEFEEPMIWSWAVGKLLEKVAKKLQGKKIVGQFHEWLAGFSILYLKNRKVPVKTVFTTHATMLGRSISGSGDELYGNLNNIDPQKEAFNKKVQDKFSIERACAQTCEVFTTVSEITGMEAEKILGRKPDVLVLNGLDMKQFPTFEETSIIHRNTREKIRDFLAYYFYPHYYFNLNDSLNFYIVGRYEFRNKGIDIFIKALGKLNQRLKAEGFKKSIITFFWIPTMVNGIKFELLESKDFYNSIKNFVEEHSQEIVKEIIRDIVSRRADSEIKNIDIFDENFTKETKKVLQNFMKRGPPPMCTHNIPNEHDDTIIRAFYDAGLTNSEEDKVKVIFYPVYLSGSDGLVNLNYYNAMAGCHLGVFASYYEPWGYTPLESAAWGVPAITSDYAGYGRFIKEEAKKAGGGIYVLERMGKSFDQQVNDFADILYTYTQLNRKQRVEQKMLAKKLADLADWNFLVDNYIKAHNLALEK